MPSSDQFTATGPAQVGFQTDGTHIDRGAEIAGTTFGVLGRGPTGVVGQGDQDGVHGIGGAGRGGRFESGNMRAQIKLEPQRLEVEDDTEPAHPFQLKGDDPDAPLPLPIAGQQGDLWMTQIPGAGHTPAALWLCVASGSTQEQPAVWSQVLLGPGFPGTMMPF
jgi:hypothetical protein